MQIKQKLVLTKNSNAVTSASSSAYVFFFGIPLSIFRSFLIGYKNNGTHIVYFLYNKLFILRIDSIKKTWSVGWGEKYSWVNPIKEKINNRKCAQQNNEEKNDRSSESGLFPSNLRLVSWNLRCRKTLMCCVYTFMRRVIFDKRIFIV